MKTIKLRNSLTKLFWVEGRGFAGTETEATTITAGSPEHSVINHTYLNVEAVESGPKMSGKDARGRWELRPYRGGIFKFYRFIGPRPFYNACGKQWTAGRWQHAGYATLDGLRSRTLRGLKGLI